MVTASRRKTSLTLDSAALDEAKDLGISVSAIADAAIQRAVSDAHRSRWLMENAEAFIAQATWHELTGHPLAAILRSVGAASGKG